jgi:hypothetical protein
LNAAFLILLAAVSQPAAGRSPGPDAPRVFEKTFIFSESASEASLKRAAGIRDSVVCIRMAGNMPRQSLVNSLNGLKARRKCLILDGSLNDRHLSQIGRIKNLDVTVLAPAGILPEMALSVLSRLGPARIGLRLQPGFHAEGLTAMAKALKPVVVELDARGKPAAPADIQAVESSGAHGRVIIIKSGAAERMIEKGAIPAGWRAAIELGREGLSYDLAFSAEKAGLSAQFIVGDDLDAAAFKSLFEMTSFGLVIVPADGKAVKSGFMKLLEASSL